jgi:hypothetical protein
MNSQSVSSLREPIGVVNTVDARAANLAWHGASSSDLEALLHYNQSAFHLDSLTGVQLPMEDEACVNAWTMYATEVNKACSLTALCKWIPQLQFPIQQGISQTPKYRAAVTRGQFVYPNDIATGVELEAPERCSLILHSTPVGRIPVIITATRADFVTLIRAFMKRSEPEAVPESMGAVIISGLNNFHRLRLLQEAHLQSGQSERGWAEEFQRIKPQKHLYQDRVVVLSDGPYSGVPAQSLQLTENRWHQLSLDIRLEHECTHYFTSRVFGSMKNNLLDELIADYCGLDKALGSYPAEWAVLFFGIEDASEYRIGGRLENYRGDPPLSPSAFRVLCRLVRSAISNLERLNLATAGLRGSSAYRAASILAIAAFTLEELAASEVANDLIAGFESRFKTIRETWITPNSDADMGILMSG